MTEEERKFPGVLVTIAGEERRLLFDFEALVILEDEFGGLYQFTQALNGGYRGKQLKALRAGLLAGGAHENVTREAVRWLTARLAGAPDFVQQVEAAMAGIATAFDQVIPPPPKEKRPTRASGSKAGRT